MPSKPRPIHTPHSHFRDTPDESEPSYSYEETSFMAQKEDDVEDEFHRRLASHHHHSSSGGGGGGNNNKRLSGGSSNNLSGGTGPSTRGSSGSLDINPATGRGSFWRTEAAPQWQPRGTPTSNSAGGAASGNDNSSATPSTSSSVKASQKQQSNKKSGGVMGRLIGSGRNNSGGPAGGFPKNDLMPKRERKTSGGLLGAALQLQSQGNKNISDNRQRTGSEGSMEVSLAVCREFVF
jgi:hypothetical protein